MSSLTIKKLPPSLHEELKHSAVENHRSLNSQAIVCLEQGLRKLKINADAWLARARTARKMVKGKGLTDSELTRAKAQGRL